MPKFAELVDRITIVRLLGHTHSLRELSSSLWTFRPLFCEPTHVLINVPLLDTDNLTLCFSIRVRELRRTY